MYRNGCRSRSLPRPPRARARFDDADALNAFEDIDFFDDLDDFEDVDHDSAIEPLIVRYLERRTPGGGLGLITGGPPLTLRGAMDQVRRSKAGIFLRGVTDPDVAEAWARGMMAASGTTGSIVRHAPHRPGERPHLHVIGRDGTEFGHIFYGAVAPTGMFFDAP
ncbi:MAG: hypothetical protein ACOY82_08295 [Pseudomonadota bacterium]|jgi:hypothetical protein